MVYFILSKTDRLVKIGYSNTPKRRLSSLINEHKKPLEIHNVIDGDRDIERYFHHKHKEYHIKGEWFKSDLLLLNDYDICYNEHLLDNIKEPSIKENKEPTAVYMYKDEKDRVKELSKLKRKKISVLFMDLMEKELKKNKL